MKKRSLFVLMILITLQGMAQRIPNWVINKPTPTNSTYLYVVESGIGQTELKARNLAVAEIFRSTAMRIGQPYDSEEISRALQKGDDYLTISTTFDIPINKVCEYTKKQNNGYKVYVLCQVAKTGDIQVEFDDFNDCYEDANKFYAEEALAADGFDVYKSGRLVRESEVRSLLANSQAYKYYESGMSVYKSTFWKQKVGGLSISEGIGYTILAAGGVMTILGYGLAPLAESDGDYKNVELLKKTGATGLVITGVSCGIFITRACVLASGKAKIRKAVNMYNNGRLYSQSELDVEYGLTGNGVFLSFSF